MDKEIADRLQAIEHRLAKIEIDVAPRCDHGCPMITFSDGRVGFPCAECNPGFFRAKNAEGR